MRNLVKKFGDLEGKNLTAIAVIITNLVKQAQAGDVKAARLLWEMSGEKTETLNLNADVKADINVNWHLENLTDAEMATFTLLAHKASFDPNTEDGRAQLTLLESDNKMQFVPRYIRDLEQ